MCVRQQQISQDFVWLVVYVTLSNFSLAKTANYQINYRRSSSVIICSVAASRRVAPSAVVPLLDTVTAKREINVTSLRQRIEGGWSSKQPTTRRRIVGWILNVEGVISLVWCAFFETQWKISAMIFIANFQATWSDDLQKMAGNSWMRVVTNRSELRTLRGAYV